MKFLYLWPLVFLILVPVIIIMYMLKQRAKDHPFSSIFLWHELYANHEADTPWEKLKKNWLLFLQLLTLLFLILAICSPYLLSGGKQAENVIVIIDNSGSMNARYQGEKSRIDEAKDQAVSLVNALRSESTVTLITCAGDDPTLVVSNTKDHASVVKQIKDLKGSCSTGNGSGSGSG